MHSQASLDGADTDKKRAGVLGTVELALVASTQSFDVVYPAALEAWCAAALLPCCPAALLPCCPAALPRWRHGARWSHGGCPAATPPSHGRHLPFPTVAGPPLRTRRTVTSVTYRHLPSPTVTYRCRSSSPHATKTLSLYVKRFRRQIAISDEIDASAGGGQRASGGVSGERSSFPDGGAFNAIRFYVAISKRKAAAAKAAAAEAAAAEAEAEAEEGGAPMDEKRAEAVILALASLFVAYRYLPLPTVTYRYLPLQVILALANLFVARPAKLNAFASLVPRVFATHLRLGSEARGRLNTLLFQVRDLHEISM